MTATWLVYGCATPAERTEALAIAGGAHMFRVSGIGFEHVAFSRNLSQDATTLHIYFSGDGSPFIHGTQIASDPTPREPLELRLMLEDPAPAVYIGRPCYVGLATAPGCGPASWTIGRYSEGVVASMTAAVQTLLDESPASHVVLIGYSGGGVLAMLVANRLARINTVVTIGANLDVEAWTQLHGYSPLSQSINPADRQEWRSSLRQIHLVGALDENVPPWIARNFTKGRAEIEVRTMAGFDHRCCWVEAWPALLTTF